MASVVITREARAQFSDLPRPIQARVAARLQRLGIGPDNPAYGRLMAKGLSRVDPRGVPPSVVEAEIARPDRQASA